MTSKHSDWLREHAAHMESCCDAYESGQMYDDAQQCKEIADALDAAEKALREIRNHSCEPWDTSDLVYIEASAALEHFRTGALHR